MRWVDILGSLWNSLREFLNSNMGTALIGGAVGSFGGAVGAQRIIEKFKERDEIVRELRSTNAAITAAFVTCNAALAVKKQHVKPLHDSFTADRLRLEQFLEDRAAGKLAQGARFSFTADLRLFSAPTIPLDPLRDLLFNKVSTPTRALALETTIEQTTQGLADLLSRREAFVKQFASIPANVQHCFYFGMPLPDGTVNQEYADFVQGIRSYVDDLIFFSGALCEDLVAHGNGLRRRLPGWARRNAPRVAEIDFSTARGSGMFPPGDDYLAYINAFVERQSTPSRWRRLWTSVLGPRP